LSVEAQPLGVEAWSLGVKAQGFGVDAQGLGVDAQALRRAVIGADGVGSRRKYESVTFNLDVRLSGVARGSIPCVWEQHAALAAINGIEAVDRCLTSLRSPLSPLSRAVGAYFKELIMSLVPKDLLAKIQFYETHNTPWAAHAVAIGSSASEITALNTKCAAARAAYDVQQAAFDAAKDATSDLRLKVAALGTAGSDVIMKIRSKAATDGDGVYVLASLPLPTIPSPIPAPGKPTDFSVTLSEAGALNIKWKCLNPVRSTGTVYQVSRRIGATGAFVFLGLSGTKSFIDPTLPQGAGNGSVTYRVQAVRSTAMGPEALFAVNFGTVGGVATANVVEPIKMAA
jgi:hypothetical protein